VRIENAINEVRGTQKSERRNHTRSKEKISGRGDALELSSAGKALSTSSGSGVRTSRVDEVRRRVEDGFYDRPEVRVAIAKAILESGVVDSVMDEVLAFRDAKKSLDQTADLRVDRVNEAREKVRSGHYNRPEVRAEVADRLTNALIG